MKKIGLLTYHAAPNYGAVLQTYAQVAYHKKIGNECQIINFVPKSFQTPYLSWFIGFAKFKFLETINSIRFYSKFKSFRDNNFKLDGLPFENPEDMKVRKLGFDVISVGSDQIWNPIWFFPGTYAWLYFLGYVSDSIKKVSVAASIGSSTFANTNLEYLLADLRRFDRVGLREKDSCDYLNELGIEAYHDFDPIFLLDKNQWSDLVSSNFEEELINGVFLFFLHNEIPDDLNLLFLSFPRGTVFFTTSNASGWVTDSKVKIKVLSPELWVKAISNSQFIITNSFHATAFCLILNKRFLSIKRLGKSAGMNNRISSLLDEVGLIHKFVINLSGMNKVPDDSSYGWENVDKIISERRTNLQDVFKKF